MYNQRNDALLFLIIIAVVSLIPTAESQPEVLGHPYEENTWYSLRCESGQRWHCSGDRLWEVQPDGVGPFQRVELGTEFAKAIPTVPGDLDILLNKKTMGVYRCSCRREGGQMLEPRTIAYFFSKGKRVGPPLRFYSMCGIICLYRVNFVPCFLQGNDFAALRQIVQLQ